MRAPALFLDRDGVINVDRGYVSRQEDFEFLPGVIDFVRWARQQGYRIVVVTNQAGIGRGYYTEGDFKALTSWMCEVFAEHGAAIDRVYFCPFHPEHGLGDYKRSSEFRKPAPGMILQAATDLDIDLGRSLLIGDKESDILAGLAAGIPCNLLFGQAQPPQSQGTSATLAIRTFDDARRYLSQSIERVTESVPRGR